jgi:hypothetical protein
MEDPLTSGDHEMPGHDAEIGEEHDGKDGPEPVGPADSNVLLHVHGGVCLKRVVAHVE